jgi:DNA repair exonuclease SbcCD ATPase subunit/DNA repair exonuclease SbcCD nuclease subunit
MRIAHLSDIHIRFSTRHAEYRQVFDRLYEDLRANKIDRIAITGDILHNKVSMSPKSFILMSEFFLKLSEIAPVDIIAGNHDMNMKQESQGDVITPIFELSEILGGKSTYQVTKENIEGIDLWEKSVYYYPLSGFYDISDTHTYGVFSCRDEKILNLDSKEPGRKYIAMWHGALYGARMDNGHENSNQASWKKSIFKDFDITMMGDFHEYQSFFEGKMGYAGSLIQQGYGESVDKGYLIWDTETSTHEKKVVLNDWGFAKITITRGESIEDRIKNMSFSNNKRKTKVIVTVEDFEENKSQERTNQIIKLIKDRYKCESIRVEWKTLDKEDLGEDGDVLDGSDSFENRFKKFMERTEHDMDEDELQELFTFAYQVEKELGLDKEAVKSKKFDILSMEVRNLFSFPDRPVYFPLESMPGLTGIFGENYCGKSNTLRALVFGLFETIIGTKNKSKLINIYTKSSKGYVSVVIAIEGIRYRITREVIQKRAGGNSYPTKFEVWKEKQLPTGERDWQWTDEETDEGTAENTNIKGQIKKAIGDYDDFSIIALHASNNDSDYLALSQQPKNALIARYLDLSNFKMRYDFVNKKQNNLNRDFKDAGQVNEIKEEIALKNITKKDLETQIGSLEEEQSLNETKRDDTNNKILELTRDLQKVENMEFDSKDVLENEIELSEDLLNKDIGRQSELKSWLDTNLRREVPFEGQKTLPDVERQLQQEQAQKASIETIKQQAGEWIKQNPKKEVNDTTNTEESIRKIQSDIIECQNKIISFQGKKCPTCGNVSEQPNPNGERQQGDRKSGLERELAEKQGEIKKSKECEHHNQALDKKEIELETLEAKIQAKQLLLESVQKDKQKLLGAKDIIAMNELIDSRSKELTKLSDSINGTKKELEEMKLMCNRFDKNEQNIASNREAQKGIDNHQEFLEGYKQSITSISLKLRSLSGELALLRRDVENREERLKEIREFDTLYRRHSLYLQAVHRQGIPAMVIRTKLPSINEKIHNILSDIVDFKVDLEIDVKGDVTEVFYFMENKFDSLPLGAMASASQKFIVTLAIKNALHEISTKAVSQPSIIMIDEGFGSLDDELISEVQGMLQYLGTKYKNVLVITHRNEVKDCVNNIVEVTKDRSFINQEFGDLPDNAGVSNFSFTTSSTITTNQHALS